MRRTRHASGWRANAPATPKAGTAPASCAGRFHRPENRSRKNLNNSSNGPLRPVNYYGIILAFLAQERTVQGAENENPKKE